MSRTFLTRRSGKQETALAIRLPRTGPGWTPPPHPQHKPTQTSRETWAIPHLADEVLNLHVTQAELQNTAACPSYQMTWNSARSSAVTAGSLTTRESPARLLNQSQRGDPARTPSNAEMLLPPPCTARPQNVLGSSNSARSLLPLRIYFSSVSLKRDFRDLALQKGEK